MTTQIRRGLTNAHIDLDVNQLGFNRYEENLYIKEENGIYREVFRREKMYDVLEMIKNKDPESFLECFQNQILQEPIYDNGEIIGYRGVLTMDKFNPFVLKNIQAFDDGVFFFLLSHNISITTPFIYTPTNDKIYYFPSIPADIPISTIEDFLKKAQGIFGIILKIKKEGSINEDFSIFYGLARCPRFIGNPSMPVNRSEWQTYILLFNNSINNLDIETFDNGSTLIHHGDWERTLVPNKNFYHLISFIEEKSNRNVTLLHYPLMASLNKSIRYHIKIGKPDNSTPLHFVFDPLWLDSELFNVYIRNPKEIISEITVKELYRYFLDSVKLNVGFTDFEMSNIGIDPANASVTFYYK
jgi:hypothetical protein